MHHTTKKRCTTKVYQFHIVSYLARVWQARFPPSVSTSSLQTLFLFFLTLWWVAFGENFYGWFKLVKRIYFRKKKNVVRVTIKWQKSFVVLHTRNLFLNNTIKLKKKYIRHQFCGRRSGKRPKDETEPCKRWRTLAIFKVKGLKVAMVLVLKNTHKPWQTMRQICSNHHKVNFLAICRAKRKKHLLICLAHPYIESWEKSGLTLKCLQVLFLWVLRALPL